MPWGRVDDTYYDHPKLDELDDVHEWPDRLAGAGLNSLAWSWCNRFLTDGKVPRATVTKLGGTIELADMLVRTGLWETASGGYQIHDFLVYNDSREQVVARREREATRKAEYRAGRRPTGTTNGTASVDDITVPASVPVGQADVSRAESRRVSQRPRARESRPVPSRPTDSPNPAERGGRVNQRANGTNPRAQGTSPRQVAAKAKAEADDEAKGRRYRAQQRQLATYRGAITDEQRIAMNERDAPLGEIPDYEEHQAALALEALL